jgi:hypothetical protein
LGLEGLNSQDACVFTEYCCRDSKVLQLLCFYYCICLLLACSGVFQHQLQRNYSFRSLSGSIREKVLKSILKVVNTIIYVFLGLNVSQRLKGEGIVFSFLTGVTNQYMLLKLQHKTLTSVPM